MKAKKVLETVMRDWSHMEKGEHPDGRKWMRPTYTGEAERILREGVPAVLEELEQEERRENFRRAREEAETEPTENLEAAAAILDSLPFRPVRVEVRDTAVEVRTITETAVLIERDGEGKAIEPECPECHARVGRPKCLFELGSACPRHALREAWIRARVAIDGRETQ